MTIFTVPAAPAFSRTASTLRQARLTAPRVLALMVAAAVALNAAVLAVRVSSLVEHGRWASTSGFEEPTLYNVWKVQNGLPLYESPTVSPYSASVYNFLFYRWYAGFATAVGAHDARLMVDARLATLLLASFGAWATYALCVSLVDRPGAWERAGFAATAALAWFGAGSLSWMILAVRPDAGAFAFSVAGLALYAQAAPTKQIRPLVLAAGAFYVGWAFKQSAIDVFGAVVLHAVLFSRWPRGAGVLLSLVGGAVALTVYGGGEMYRINTLALSAGHPLLASAAASAVGRTLAYNPGPMLLAAAVAVLAVNERRRLAD
ncbi:MAG: hypothetical protein ACRDD1_01050, partial [Planctomycetia bacterium]